MIKKNTQKFSFSQEPCPMKSENNRRVNSALVMLAGFFEGIGRLTIVLFGFGFNIVHKLLWSTLDASFFLLFLFIRFCEGVGSMVLSIPFQFASNLLAVLVFKPFGFVYEHLLVHLESIISTLLGVPTTGAVHKRKIAALAKISQSRATTLTWPKPVSLVRELVLGYVTLVDNYLLFRRRHALAFVISGGTVLTLPLVALVLYQTVIKDLPFPTRLRTHQPALTTRIFDRNGKLLYKVYRNANRTVIPLAEIPLYVQQATIAIEDHKFYSHPGVDPRGVIRAAIANYTNKEVSQGASTITQQLIKNTLLTPERTLTRKLKEIFLSVVAEVIFSKQEILEMYLNTVCYGGIACGVEEAAQTYFKKSARDLTLAEAALVAGLPTAPTTFSPHGSHPELARVRQKQTLHNMVQLGFISQQQAEEAIHEELAIAAPNVSIRAPHFVMYVKDYLTERYGRKMVEEGGLQVYTTLDLDIQEKAEQIVEQENKELRSRYGANNAAAMVTHPKTGEILAWVGSADYWDQSIKGNVNIITSPRQPGSSIKVVNYGYALSHGFTPSSIVYDTPVVYNIAGSTPYAPKNYDGKFHGAVTIRQALARSYNVPAVKVLATYGPQKMVEMGQRMGISTWNNLKHFGLSMTLGAGDVTMEDMAVVYGTIANLGVRHDLTPIKEITDHLGKRLDPPAKNFTAKVVGDVQAKDKDLLPTPTSHDGEAVLSPSVAYWLIDILSDNKARLVAFGPYSKLEIPGHKVAVKTGTTDNFRDNWTFGFTPDYLVASWVGNTDNKPMRGLVSGITGAAPIWHNIMEYLLKDAQAQEFDKPAGLVPVKICASTGTLACTYCKDIVSEYFIPGTEPKQTCNIVSPDECAKRKAQAESEGKSAEETLQIMAGCSLPSPTP